MNLEWRLPGSASPTFLKTTSGSTSRAGAWCGSCLTGRPHPQAITSTTLSVANPPAPSACSSMRCGTGDGEEQVRSPEKRTVGESTFSRKRTQVRQPLSPSDQPEAVPLRSARLRPNRALEAISPSGESGRSSAVGAVRGAIAGVGESLERLGFRAPYTNVVSCFGLCSAHPRAPRMCRPGDD